MVLDADGSTYKINSSRDYHAPMNRLLHATFLVMPLTVSSCGTSVDHGQVVSNECVDDSEGLGSYYLKVWADGYSETHTPRDWTCAEFFDDNGN